MSENKKNSTSDVDVFEPKSFEDLKFDLPEILYNPDLPQVVPFMDRRRTANGTIDVRVAHVMGPLSDERFMVRERELNTLAKQKKTGVDVFGDAKPTEVMWGDIVLDRVGYKPHADWKKKVKLVDKIGVLNAMLHIELVDEEVQESIYNDDFLLDEDDQACLVFHALFSGISLDEWKDWFISGSFPSNIEMDYEIYETLLMNIRRGVSPNILLKVKHFFKEAIKSQLDEALSLLFGGPNRSKLASSARNNNEPLASDRWLTLYDQVATGNEGYAKRVPKWHKIESVRAYFAQELARLGESVRE